MTIHNASRTQRDTAKVMTTTFTTHVVDIDLAALLGNIDVADGQVILAIQTPSGRAKRITLGANFLVPSRFEDPFA